MILNPGPKSLNVFIQQSSTQYLLLDWLREETKDFTQMFCLNPLTPSSLTHMWLLSLSFIACNKLIGFELFIYLSRRKPNGNDFISIYFAFLDIYSTL